MEDSKSNENYKPRQQKKNEENAILEIVEQEIRNIVVIADEQTKPSCSWQVTDKTSNKETIIVTTMLTESEELVTSPPQTNFTCNEECQHDHEPVNQKFSVINPNDTDLPSEESSLGSNSSAQQNPQTMPSNGPPAYAVNVGNASLATDGGLRINLQSMIPTLPRRESLVGPPPSYSKSLLDRRINACASIQFVAPIPPPSYDGTDHELRYANVPGFTLGIGNTWQSQSQPAYCIVCEMVTITRTEVRVSSVAHTIALILFFLLCWPFCLLPYFLNFFNYTFHYCSVCQSFLGARRPFQRN